MTRFHKQYIIVRIMGMYTLSEIIRILKEKEITLFTLADFSRLFNLENNNTLYKKIQRLEKKKIIERLTRGKYLFLFGKADDFLIANFLYQPSYISLESALSFYGIITAFPYQITSIATKKTKNITTHDKEFSYSRIKKELFWGYEKRDDFLIAEKEKALLDYLYFSLKGKRVLDWKEVEKSELDKKKLLLYARRFKDQKLLAKVKERFS